MKRRTLETCKLCGSTYYAKGFCKFHYDRKRFGRNPEMQMPKKQNEYEIYGDVAIFTYYNKEHIPIGEFKIDKNNVDKIKDYKWSIINTGYIVTYQKKKMILLHRFLTNCPKGLVVDHINHDKKDNRLCNLRVCTQKQNMENCDFKKMIESRKRNKEERQKGKINE